MIAYTSYSPLYMLNARIGSETLNGIDDQFRDTAQRAAEILRREITEEIPSGREDGSTEVSCTIDGIHYRIQMAPSSISETSAQIPHSRTRWYAPIAIEAIHVSPKIKPAIGEPVGLSNNAQLSPVISIRFQGGTSNVTFQSSGQQGQNFYTSNERILHAATYAMSKLASWVELHAKAVENRQYQHDPLRLFYGSIIGR